MAGLIWHTNYQSIQHGHILRGLHNSYYPLTNNYRILLPPSGVNPGEFPIKFTESTEGLNVPENGSMEYINGHLYFTINDQRVQIDQTGDGSGLVYNNTNPIQTPIGGISIGETFENVSFQELFTRLLYPYLNPTFTGFYINGQSSVLEVGDTVPASKQFIWSTSNSANVLAGSIELRDITSNTVMASGITNLGAYLVNTTDITRLNATSYTWRITGENTKSSFFTRDYSVTWRWRIYYGESNSDTLDESSIKALRVNNLATSYTGNYGMNSGGYKYIAIPSSFGVPTQFKDALSGFGIAMETPYEVGITNSFGVIAPYRVFRTTNIIGSAITIIVA